ncbi:MAG: cytochrome P450 [Frankiaceae bacterium]
MVATTPAAVRAPRARWDEPRTALRWGAQSLVPQLVLRRAARHGQLGARLAVDRSLWADPFGVYEQMRAQGPLLGRGRICATVSHRVASEALRGPAFGVEVAATARVPPLLRRMLALTADPWAVGPAEPPSMLAVDPPDHTRYRRLVSKVLTPRALAELEPRIEQLASELLAGMEHRARAGDGVVDLIEAYAGPLPVAVIAEILGIPVEMRPRMLALGDAAAVTLDPVTSYRQFRAATAALREIHHWLAGHLAELRQRPGDDLLSRLAAVTDSGDALDEVELRATALLVIGAGFETTVNLIANGVAQLLAHPDQLALLRAEPSRWPDAVDEILRFDSPVQVTLRVATADTELADRALPAGQFVSIMLGGANRDPEVFDHPQAFDIARRGAREHLAFSAGVHFCLGASLARMEGAIALRMLVERFPALALAPGAVRRRMRVLRGYQRLPVRLGRDACA